VQADRDAIYHAATADAAGPYADSVCQPNAPDSDVAGCAVPYFAPKSNVCPDDSTDVYHRAYGNAVSYRNGDRDLHTRTDADNYHHFHVYAVPDANAHVHADADDYAYQHAYAYAYQHADKHAYANADADDYPHRLFQLHHCAGLQPVQHIGQIYYASSFVAKFTDIAYDI